VSRVVEYPQGSLSSRRLRSGRGLGGGLWGGLGRWLRRRGWGGWMRGGGSRLGGGNRGLDADRSLAGGRLARAIALDHAGLRRAPARVIVASRSVLGPALDGRGSRR
jgi:hypothetical protein